MINPIKNRIKFSHRFGRGECQRSGCRFHPNIKTAYGLNLYLQKDIPQSKHRAVLVMHIVDEIVGGRYC